MAEVTVPQRQGVIASSPGDAVADAEIALIICEGLT